MFLDDPVPLPLEVGWMTPLIPTWSGGWGLLILSLEGEVALQTKTKPELKGNYYFKRLLNLWVHFLDDPVSNPSEAKLTVFSHTMFWKDKNKFKKRLELANKKYLYRDSNPWSSI